MPRTRSPYPPKFRRQMAELVRAERTPRELAREFEPSYETIRTWVRQADRDDVATLRQSVPRPRRHASSANSWPPPAATTK
jgi:transposase